MHFLSITEVYPAKLKSEEKRQALTLQRVDEYNQCIRDSHILLPNGPFSLIDMHHLTKGKAHPGYTDMMTGTERHHISWLAPIFHRLQVSCNRISPISMPACQSTYNGWCTMTCVPVDSEHACLLFAITSQLQQANQRMLLQAAVQTALMMACIIVTQHMMPHYRYGSTACSCRRCQCAWP